MFRLVKFFLIIDNVIFIALCTTIRTDAKTDKDTDVDSDTAQTTTQRSNSATEILRGRRACFLGRHMII
jgi:hypothetical protein